MNAKDLWTNLLEKSVRLDLSLQSHAAAYLIAASHFLSEWPQNWTADYLRDALVLPEGREYRGTCLVAAGFVLDLARTEDHDDPYDYVEEMISHLACDIIRYGELLEQGAV